MLKLRTTLGVLLGSLLLAGQAQAQRVYFNTSSATQASNTLASVSASGTNLNTFFTATGPGLNNVARCTAIAVDSQIGKIFLLDGLSNALWSVNANGSGLTLIKSGLTNYPTDLALDVLNQKIYYTTSSTVQSNNTVQRMDYTGASNITVFTATGISPGNGAQRCTALAVDTLNAKIFFADVRGQTVWTMGLGGAGLTALATAPTNTCPTGIALDVTNQLVYFSVSSPVQSSNMIRRVNYNGSGLTTLFTAAAPVQRCTALDLDAVNAVLYLSDAGTNALWRIPASGGSATLVASNLTATAKKVRWVSRAVLNAPAITSQPTGVLAELDDNVTFTASATGDAPLFLSWRKNGVPIPGATNTFYTIPSVSAADVGSYSMLASNPVGTALSSNATLTLRSQTTLTQGLMSVRIDDEGACIDSVKYAGGELYKLGYFTSDWGLQSASNITTFRHNANAGNLADIPMVRQSVSPVSVTYTGVYAVSGTTSLVTRAYAFVPGLPVLKTTIQLKNTGPVAVTLRSFDTFDPDAGGTSTLMDRFSVTNASVIQMGQAVSLNNTTVVLAAADAATLIGASGFDYSGILDGTRLNTFNATGGADSNGSLTDGSLDIGASLLVQPGATRTFTYYHSIGATPAEAQNNAVNILNAGPRVAIVAAEGNTNWIQEVRAQILNASNFAGVDIFRVDSGNPNPTLPQLQRYAATLVFSDSLFADPTGLGNVLADYVDGGGGVVVSTFALGDTPVTGRFETQGYLPVTLGTFAAFTTQTMTVDRASHPIMAGVATLNGGTSSYHATGGTLRSGGQLLAHWSDGSPLVTAAQRTRGRTVALNFFPPSSDSRGDFWVTSTDGGRLLANALLWSGTPDAPRVAVLGSPSTEAWNEEVRTNLLAAGLFSSVDAYLVGFGRTNPTLAQLLEYPAVLVYSDGGLADAAGLGNTLADYVDAGGGVVIGTFALQSGFQVGGRFDTQAYLPVTLGVQSGGVNLGMVADSPNHPILQGVASFNGGSSSYHASGLALRSNTVQVAHWTDASPLVVAQQRSRGRVVALNLYPPSSKARSDFWTASTDGARLMANSLAWSAWPTRFVNSSTAFAGNAARMELRTPPYAYAIIESSSDLRTWTPAASNFLGASGVWFYTNTVPGIPRQFYRAYLP